MKSGDSPKETNMETQITTPQSVTEQTKEQGMEKKSPTKRVSKAVKIGMLRELLRQGVSKEKICEHMNISDGEFLNLFFLITQEDGKSYKIPFTRAARKVKVGQKGGFQISADNIERLGLTTVFEPGAILDIQKEDEIIVVSVSKEAKSEVDDTSTDDRQTEYSGTPNIEERSVEQKIAVFRERN